MEKPSQALPHLTSVYILVLKDILLSYIRSHNHISLFRKLSQVFWWQLVSLLTPSIYYSQEFRERLPYKPKRKLLVRTFTGYCSIIYYSSSLSSYLKCSLEDRNHICQLYLLDRKYGGLNTYNKNTLQIINPQKTKRKGIQ